MLDELKGIASKLTAADRTFQKEIGWSFLLRSTKWILAVVLLYFALDVFLHLNVAPRVVLLGALAALLFSVLGRSGYLALIRRNQLERIARLLESRDPALGSKLINVLQLQEQSTDSALSPLTRQMAAQAVSTYAKELEKTDFRRLAVTGRLRTDFKEAFLIGLAFVGLLGIAFKISIVEIPRFVDPFGDHPPYSFTQLEITDPGEKGIQVIYKKNALIKVTHSGHRPNEVFLTFFPPNHPEQSTTIPMFSKGDAGFYQEIANIQTDLLVFAHTKNQHAYSKKRPITVLLTPKLEKAFVQIAPPPYTGLKAEEKAYQFKNFRALEGSVVQFRLQSNRPLREGFLEVVNANKQIQRVPLKKNADNEVVGAIEVKDSASMRFSMVDIDGIASEDLWEGSLTITHDLPPDIQISNPSKDCFVSMDFKLEAQIDAHDDYGIKTIRVHRALNQVYSTPKTVHFDSITRDAHEVVPFNFQDLGLRSGDVISFFAEAIDTAPATNFARSETINVTVITEDEYNTFLRQQMDITDLQNKYSELINQMHERIDEQRKVGDEIDKLKSKLAKAGPKEKEALQRDLDQMIAKQNELNQNLNKLADRMETFVRKNPVYDVESELQNVLSEKAKNIRESTEANNAASRKVAQQSSPPSGPRQVTPEMLSQFKNASDDQVAKLAGVEKETEEKVAEPLADLGQLQELLKDFNRFEQLFETQQNLTEQARAYNRSTALSREDQLALKNLAGTENQVTEELEQLQKSLRENAKVAEKLFPKAAQSGRDLADKMEELRLRPLAEQATGDMLAGKGEGSFQTSDRLRGEMEKLLSHCDGQQGEMSQELDRYLQAQRGMKAGRTFQQMMQSQKGGAQGKGMAIGGKGEGKGGRGGYVVTSGPTMDVFGNESSSSKSNAGSKQPGKPGFGATTTNGNENGLVFDKPDVVKGVAPVNRQSDAVNSETTVEEYRTLVEKYFKTISK